MIDYEQLENYLSSPEFKCKSDKWRKEVHENIIKLESYLFSSAFSYDFNTIRSEVKKKGRFYKVLPNSPHPQIKNIKIHSLTRLMEALEYYYRKKGGLHYQDNPDGTITMFYVYKGVKFEKDLTLNKDRFKSYPSVAIWLN